MSSLQIFMLGWLGKEETSAYGECCGPALDGLVAEGLAIVDRSELRGRHEGYALVSLTEAGHAKRKELQADG